MRRGKRRRVASPMKVLLTQWIKRRFNIAKMEMSWMASMIQQPTPLLVWVIGLRLLLGQEIREIT